MCFEGMDSVCSISAGDEGLFHTEIVLGTNDD